MASNHPNPNMSPHTGTFGHVSHGDNSGKREKKEKKKGGLVEGKQKNKKSTKTENNRLKEKQRLHNTLPNVVPNS